jgi:hypothetical protein
MAETDSDEGSWMTYTNQIGIVLFVLWGSLPIFIKYEEWSFFTLHPLLMLLSFVFLTEGLLCVTLIFTKQRLAFI